MYGSHDLPVFHCRESGPFEELIQGQPPFSLDACQCDFRAHDYEGRRTVGRRGSVAKVACDRAHIADFNVRHYLNRVSKGRIVIQDVGMGSDFRKPSGCSYGQALLSRRNESRSALRFRCRAMIALGFRRP